MREHERPMGRSCAASTACVKEPSESQMYHMRRTSERGVGFGGRRVVQHVDLSSHLAAFIINAQARAESLQATRGVLSFL